MPPFSVKLRLHAFAVGLVHARAWRETFEVLLPEKLIQ